MKNLLRSTTSLGLSLALAFPHGAFAQEPDAPVCAPVGETSEFPCRFDDQLVNDAEELRIAAELTAEAEADAAEGEANAEGDAAATAETDAEENADGETLLEEAGNAAEAASETAEEALEEAEDQAAEAEAAVEAEAEAATDAAAETADEAEAAAEAEAEATAETSTEAETSSDGTAQAETAAEEPMTESEQIRNERGATPQAEAGVEAEAEAEAEVEADAEVEAEAAEAASAEAGTAEETPTETEEIRNEREVPSQAETEAEASAESDANADAQADAEAPASAEAEDEAAAQAGLTEEQRQAREERREERRAERREQRRAERRAEREAAAAAAAAAAENEEAGEVVTEEVTEEDVRSASEDFETEVTTTGQASAAANDDDDDGLSNFEKALLLGLGAVAVGSVLNNGDKIVSSTGDRVVVQDENGDLRVLKDDNALLRRPGDQVQTQTFDDGSTRTIVTKADGSRIETIRARDGSVLRRTHFDAQGREYVLVDDLVEEREVEVNELPQVQETPEPRRASAQDEEALRRALQAELRNDQGRTFSLRQVREIREVRALAPELELDAVRFPTGSAAIQPEQARALANIGTTLRDLIAEDPRTVILVEGHTDAVGDATYNLALSDRRAETVALALTEYFDVPPENLITQGYGESQLRVPTTGPEPANRRAVVRNITGLLR